MNTSDKHFMYLHVIDVVNTTSLTIFGAMSVCLLVCDKNIWALHRQWREILLNFIVLLTLTKTGAN